MIKRFLIVFISITILSSHIYTQFPRRTSPGLTRRNQMPFPVRKKPNSKQKKKLEPGDDDLIKYAQFLSQPKTGIFRLFPDLGCEENPNVIKVDKKCLEAIPESSFYSFREKEHTAQYLSDIRLKDGYFITDGVLTNGFLVSLGNVELEKVSLSTEALKFMQSYSAKTEGAEAQKQHLQMSRGIRAGNFLYRKVFPVAENTTYALRVIAFRGNIYRTFRGYRYNVLSGDKRIDITIAFRVIKKNTDDSITILWKELDRREAPKFKFSKKTTDKILKNER